MCKTRPENDYVYPPLDLRPHQTRQRRQSLLALRFPLLQLLPDDIISLRPFVQLK